MPKIATPVNIMTQPTVQDAPPGNDGFTQAQVNQELFLELQKTEAEKLELARQLQELLNAVETMQQQQAPPTVLQERSTKPRFAIPDFSKLNLGSLAPCICFTVLAMYTLNTVTQLTPSAQVVKLAEQASANVTDVTKIQGRANETKICVVYCPPETAVENGVQQTIQPQAQQVSPPPVNVPLAPPQAPKIYLATVTQNANLRSAPDVNSSVLYTIPGGDHVIPQGQSGDWLKVVWVQVDKTQNNGYKVLETGYVASALIQQ